MMRPSSSWEPSIVIGCGASSVAPHSSSTSSTGTFSLIEMSGNCSSETLMAWTATNARFLQQVRIYGSRWTTIWIRLPKSTLSHHEEIRAKDRSTEGPHSKNDGDAPSREKKQNKKKSIRSFATTVPHRFIVAPIVGASERTSLSDPLSQLRFRSLLFSHASYGPGLLVANRPTPTRLEYLNLSTVLPVPHFPFPPHPQRTLVTVSITPRVLSVCDTGRSPLVAGTSPTIQRKPPNNKPWNASVVKKVNGKTTKRG